MNKDLPIYNVVLKDDSQGVGFISLVDEPAIQVNWIKLAKQEVMTFKADTEKQMLYGPFLIPNKLIYRFDEKSGAEYYVRFSDTEIEKIAMKFNEDLNSKNINFQHTDKKVEAFVSTNWIIDGGKDKSQNFGFDLPKGTWFGGVKIKDSEFWKNQVKSEEVKGFSVEILADLELQLKSQKINNDKMKKEIKLASAKLIGGTEVYYDGEFGMGTAIFTDEAMTTPAPEGEHTLEDGTVITLTDGKVTEIEIPAITEEAQADTPATPQALTAQEVSSMIDARFQELMNEISALKENLGKKEDEFTKYRKDIEVKFSTTPAKEVEKVEVKKFKIDMDFERAVSRIKELTENKKAK